MKKLSFITLLLLATIGPTGAVEPATPERLDDVVQRGTQIMPFDLDKTLHVFTKIDTGGLQQVVAKEAGDSEQIRLIREHLAQLAARLALGDFSGPGSIHGTNMPGLAELQAGVKQVRFVYRELPNGAQIAYTTGSPALVSAIHRYFDTQLSDHARHAIGGHHGHHP